MGFRVVGIQPQRLFVAIAGGFERSDILENHAEITVCRGVPGPQLHDAAVAGQSFFEALLAFESETEILPGIGVFGIQFDSLLPGRISLRPIPQISLRVAPALVNATLGRANFCGALKALQSPPRIAEFQKRQAKVQQSVERIGAQLTHALKGGRGEIERAGFIAFLAKGKMRRRTIGADFQQSLPGRERLGPLAPL